MNQLRRILSRLMTWFAALSIWLATSEIALAKAKTPEKPPGKSYVMAYMLVAFLIALGLLAVCRPGHRTKELKAKELEAPDE